jgi:hypothetical protein
MKLFWSVFSIGLVFYYLIVRAFKLDIFTGEMLGHTAYHFFSGFIVLAGWCFYKSKRRFKMLLVMVFCILFLDELIDYFRGIDGISSTLLAYNLYLLLWGALSGGAVIRYWRHRKEMKTGY